MASQKRKADGYASSGTVTGHCVSMDNALILLHENIKRHIEYRGHNVYPTYSPELNPIKQILGSDKE